MENNLYLVVALSILVTYLWRGAGVLLAARIDPNGKLFEWLNCVAYAMLAGLMARVMIFPVGVLAETSSSDRGIAMACGFAVFFLFKRNFFAGTLVSIVVFYGLLSW